MESNIKNGTELLKMRIREIPTLVKPIIPRIGIIALTGTSDIGKSTLLLQLCSDLVLNDDFLGFPIDAKHKSSIYVSTEDDEFVLSHRLQRLANNGDDSLENMRFIFNSENLVSTIDRELTKKKADVVVIDTFADIFSGEMNQVNKVRSFMNDYQNLAIKHKCLVIFNHHTGKYSEEKPPNKNNSIGSQGFEGKCRMVIEMRQDYNNPDIKHLCIVKGNYLGSEYKERSFEIFNDGEAGFCNTGKRMSFDLLAKPKLFKAVANREVEKEMARAMKKEKKSNSEILKALKEEGHTVAKSTLSDWLKDLSD